MWWVWYLALPEDVVPLSVDNSHLLSVRGQTSQFFLSIQANTFETGLVPIDATTVPTVGFQQLGGAYPLVGVLVDV